MRTLLLLAMVTAALSLPRCREYISNGTATDRIGRRLLDDESFERSLIQHAMVKCDERGECRVLRPFKPMGLSDEEFITYLDGFIAHGEYLTREESLRWICDDELNRFGRAVTDTCSDFLTVRFNKLHAEGARQIAELQQQIDEIVASVGNPLKTTDDVPPENPILDMSSTVRVY